MFEWFEKVAPIRSKFRTLSLAIAILGALALLGTLGLALGLIPAWAAIILSALGFLLAVTVTVTAGNVICTPYVNMVVRIEKLIAGDTTTPINFTEYRDCVGRMARAMVECRANVLQIEQARVEQQEVMQSLGDALKLLANNQLSCKIDKPFPASYENLRHDFNAATSSLTHAILTVRQSAGSVLNGSREIRAASSDLAMRNEQQAASLEETVAALNQVTEGVKQSAQAARDVERSVAEAHHETTTGGEVVARAIEAMAEIESSSQKISQIIGVIDGIAFQTNLLALNAGVEAARAGDAGRGFAVVANEVRALAQRSADAAKDIKVLINTSTSQIGSGVALVGETGDLLNRIVARIGEINVLLTSIAAHTATQSTNLQQVNSAVNDMDRATQQNAAMVEQSTAAARSLSDEARELASVVARFTTKTEETDTSVVPFSRDNSVFPSMKRAAAN